MFYDQTVRSENSHYSKNAHKNNSRFIINCNSVIADEDLRFQIEKIPPGLNFLDLIKFKNLSTSSINGNIVKVFTLKDHLIYLYTLANSKPGEKVLLLEKLEFLKSIISEKIECELWIVKDANYLCIGMFNAVPVFIKTFNSIFEINDHMQMMSESMNQYSIMQNIRFFCCNSNGFYKNNVNIFEYSEQFMLEIMQNHTSINEYCKDMQKQKIVKNKKNVVDSFVLGSVLLGCAGVFYFTEEMNLKTKLQIERLNIVSNNSLPSKNHYQQIKELELELE